MSASSHPDPAVGAGDDAEVVDAVPVAEGMAPHRAAAAPRHADAPAVAPAAVAPTAPQVLARGALPGTARATAVAVTGFAAGAVTAAVVRSASRRRAARVSRRSPQPLLPVICTRSFLIDVHLLGPRE